MGNQIRVSDGRTLAVFSADTKGALSSLKCGPAGRELVATEPDLWVIETPNGSTIRPSAADSFTSMTDQGQTILSWKFYASKLEVRVRLKPLGKGKGVAAHWTAGLGSAEGLRIAEIHFPNLRAADSLEKVTDPGTRYAGLRHALRGAGENMGGLYPGIPAVLQCFAAWGGGPDGLYVGAHDPRGYTKTLTWTGRAIRFTFHQPDPDKPRKGFEVPYDVVLGSFIGDWQDGLDYYREWVRKNATWCKRGTLMDYGPEWAKTSPVWIYSVGDSPFEYEELFPRVRAVFGINGPVGIHALGASVQDHSNMPDGEPQPWFLKMRKRQSPMLKKLGIYVFEYRNGHKYTKGFTGFEAAAPHAVRFHGAMHEEGPYEGGAGFRCSNVPAGTPGSRQIGVGADAFGVLTARQNYPLVEMCMGTSFWRALLVKEIKPLPEYGMVGSYIDQVGYNPNASRCDAPNHGHPLRGGYWYASSHVKALKDIITCFQSKGVKHPVLSHEFLSEPLIGLLNTALLDWDITVLSYVYHPYMIFESHEPYDGVADLKTLRQNLAHDFHSGRMPSLDVPCKLPGVSDMSAVLRDKNNPADEPAFQMMRHWLGVRSAWLTYLNLGDMLHTPKLLPESGNIMASAWKSPNGGIALFFSNITDQPQEVAIDLSTYPPGLKWRMWLNARQAAGSSIKGRVVRRTLSTDDTLILEARTSK